MSDTTCPNCKGPVEVVPHYDPFLRYAAPASIFKCVPCDLVFEQVAQPPKEEL